MTEAIRIYRVLADGTAVSFTQLGVLPSAAQPPPRRLYVDQYDPRVVDTLRYHMILVSLGNGKYSSCRDVLGPCWKRISPGIQDSFCQLLVLRLHHSTCESRPRLRGLGPPEKEVLGVGGLVVVGWGFQEPLIGSRATRASPILIFRGPLALSIMFLIVLLHPRMPSASKVEYDLR